MKSKIALLLLSFLFINKAQAQIQVSDASIPPFTPENLISNYFLGEGVKVLNITYEGKNTAVGYFDKAKNNVGIQRGIVMTTGRVANDPTNPSIKGITNPASQNASTANGFGGADPDIAKLLKQGQSVKDMAKYTITFIPTSDTLRFKYVFASEEYPEYACSAFNDAFGFFISGPGISGPYENNGANIALVPGTNLPVSIDNVHPQNGAACPPKNAQYYIANNGVKQPVYDGLTKVFTAEAIVIPCETYTIKLIICDASDEILDSGVFLEAKSFGTGTLRVEPQAVSLDGTVIEGCTDGKVTFRLPKKVDEPFNIDVKLIGTAKNGIDYEQIPLKLQIPNGDSSITIPIIAIGDNLKEGTESIGFDVQVDVCHRDTFWIYINDNKIVRPNLGKDTIICKGETFSKNATLPIALPPPLVFENKDSVDVNTVTPFDPKIPATVSNIKVFGVQPVQLQAGMIESVCVNIKHQWIDDVDCYLIAPNGQFIDLTTDNGGSGGNGAGLDYYKNTCFKPSASVPITSGSSPFTGDFQAEGPWSDLWGAPNNPANGTWKLQLIDDQTGAQGKLLDWKITFKPYYEIKYKWTPTKGLSCSDCPNPIFKPDSTTTYIVDATDNYGCPVSDTITVFVEDSLKTPTILCNFVTHNTIQFAWQPILYAKGYEVSIDNGPWIKPTTLLTHKITGLSLLQNVSIRVRAIGNCGGKIGYGSCQTLNCISATPKIDALSDISCFGLNDGAIKLTATDGLPPYTFKLGGQTNGTGFFDKLTPGNYTVAVTEQAGCISTVKFIINEPKKLKFAYAADSVTCFGGSDATAIVIASGGTLPFSYQWSNGVTDSIATDLIKNKYIVTIKDANNCQITDTVRVYEPPTIKLLTETENIKCYDALIGAARVIPSGGEAPYYYKWDTNQGLQITPKAVNLSAGQHYVTVTDNRGCKSKTSVIIKAPDEIELTKAGKNTKCFGDKNGTVSIKVKGGTSPYNYLWNDSGKTKDTIVTNLESGVYIVTVTDKNGCFKKDSVKITQPDSFFIILKTYNPFCFGAGTGGCIVKPQGGTFPYLVTNSGGVKNGKDSIGGLFGNTNYSITVTDLQGCVVNGKIKLDEPDSLSTSFTIKTASCSGTPTGEIDLAVSGGKKPYTYKWSGNGISDTTQDVTALKSGVYTVEISDSNQCQKVLKINVSEPNAVQIQETLSDVKCKGTSTGAISLDVLGGILPYSYNWSNGLKTKNINLLSAGKYTLALTDGKGCITNAEYEIKEPLEKLNSQIGVNDTLCFAQKGEANLTVNGGTIPYTFLWSNGEITEDLKAIVAGNYSVLISDANKCTLKDTAFLYGLGEIAIKLSQTTASCNSFSDGKAQIEEIFYGNTKANLSKFNVEWSNLATNFSIDKLTGGQTYSVNVTDTRGCKGTNDIKIGNPNAIKLLVISSSLPKCYGDKNGELKVEGIGGTTPYTYQWDTKANNQITDKATGLAAGIYDVTITDNKGCFTSVQTTLNEPKPLDAALKVKGLACPQTPTGAAEAQGLGGTQPYTYLWSNKETKSLISGLLSGVYTVKIKDINGCAKDTNVFVSQPTPLDLKIAKEDVRCSGQKNGTAKAIVTGGTPPFLYSFNNKDFSGQNTFAGLKPNVYSMIVKDKNGCLFQEDVEINEPFPITVNLGKDSSIFYGKSVALFPIVTGTVGKISFLWSPYDSSFISCERCETPIVAPKSSTLFSLKVIDEKGCVGVGEVNISILIRDVAFVPTGFSPNNDGNNDLLLIHGEKGTKVLSFSVYDKWGERLYTQENTFVNDDKIGWDGTFRGNNMPPDVYAWSLVIEFINGEKKNFRGSTTLIRN
jgi:gliding motility-associated-like protein